MRSVAVLEGNAPAAPDVVYRRLKRHFEQEPYLDIVKDDPVARELRVEGNWWFHGCYNVDLRGVRGSRVRFEVFSKLGGWQAVVGAVPVRQGVREARSAFGSLLEELAHRDR